MSIIHRFAKNTPSHKGSAAVARQQNHVESQEFGRSGQIVCSPWEGIYLEQGHSWDSGRDEAVSALSIELERFLTSVLDGGDLRGELVGPDFSESSPEAE